MVVNYLSVGQIHLNKGTPITPQVIDPKSRTNKCPAPLILLARKYLLVFSKQQMLSSILYCYGFILVVYCVALGRVFTSVTSIKSALTISRFVVVV